MCTVCGWVVHLHRKKTHYMYYYIQLPVFAFSNGLHPLIISCYYIIILLFILSFDSREHMQGFAHFAQRAVGTQHCPPLIGLRLIHKVTFMEVQCFPLIQGKFIF